MLFGEVHPSGHFRFVNFGHPPPLLFSTRTQKFVEVDRDRMVQFIRWRHICPATEAIRDRSGQSTRGLVGVSEEVSSGPGNDADSLPVM